MNFINISVILKGLSFFVFLNDAGYSPIIIIIIIIIIILCFSKTFWFSGLVAIVTMLMVRRSGIRVPVDARTFIFFKMSYFLSGPFSLLLNGYRVFFERVKQPRRETSHSSTSSLDIFLNFNFSTRIFSIR